jgi:hypothetical protein
MKGLSKLYYSVFTILAVVFPSTGFADPEVANFSTQTGTLSIPFLKIDGSPTFKNVELVQDAATGQFQLTALEEIPPQDIIKVDTTTFLAAGSTQDFPFQGMINVPVLITTERSQTSNLIYRISILDANQFVRFQTANIAGGIAQTAFTPTFDDTFTIRLEGVSGSGDLKIEGEVLTSGPVSDRSVPEPIAAGGTAEGTLAEGAFDDYTYAGTAGTPVTIQTQRTSGSLIYRVQIADSAKFVLHTTVNIAGGTAPTPFTPQTTETFTISIQGVSSFGDYVLELQ